MSDQQLKRILNEKEKMQDELAMSKNITKVSEACEILINYVKGTPEPFSAEFSQPNVWQAGGGGCCTII